MVKYLLFFVLAVCLVSRSTAQNTITSYLETGSASAVDNFAYGATIQADIILSEFVAISGGVRLNNLFPSGLGTLKVGAMIYPCPKKRNWEIVNTFLFSNYAPYPLNEIYYRIIGAWHNNYLRIEVGNGFRFLVGSGVVKRNLLRPLLSVKGTIRPPDKIWNISLFARNFNRFQTHGQDRVEWGGEVPVKVDKHWIVFCEAYVATVGNSSGTANYFNTNVNIGAIYKW